MSDDTTTTRDADNSSVFSSPEIYSPVFENGSVEDIRRAANSPVYKLLRRLVDERLGAVAPAAK